MLVRPGASSGLAVSCQSDESVSLGFSGGGNPAQAAPSGKLGDQRRHEVRHIIFPLTKIVLWA